QSGRRCREVYIYSWCCLQMDEAMTKQAAGQAARLRLEPKSFMRVQRKDPVPARLIGNALEQRVYAMPIRDPVLEAHPWPIRCPDRAFPAGPIHDCLGEGCRIAAP